MADNLRSTPQSPALGALARLLRGTQEFAERPFGYPNPPVAMLSEAVGLPALQRTVERMSYGEPLTTGRGQTLQLRPDTAESIAAVAPLAGPLARAAGRGAMAAGRAGERLAERVVPQVMDRGGLGAEMLRAMSSGTASNVIKPRGGNWLAGQGSAEEAVQGLKPRVNTAAETPQVLAKYGLTPEQLQALPRAERLKMYDEFLAPENRQVLAMENWLDQKLAKYIRNEMGTPEDPVRALAERGVLHVDPEDLNYRLDAYGKYAAPGQEFMAGSDAAKLWEGASDLHISPATAEHAAFYNALGANLTEHNPWLTRVPPDTPVYSLADPRGLASDLGFTHLVDELRNATRAGSDLPRELQLSPEQLGRVSMPQAVELVDRINKWRAAQKADADLSRSTNAAVFEHKAYPEQGYRWVELKAPPAERLSDDQLRSLMQGRDMLPDEIEAALRDPDTRAMIADEAASAGETGPLAKALEYEGEAMGHCVGGYCPDVAEGRSRIFSLRDAKGQPHVTIEVQPGRAPSQSESQLQARAEGLRGQAFAERVFELMEGKETPSNIVQIKGKANRAPKDDYLPFVQDFVKSQRWGRIGDIKNTGLRPTRDVFNPAELEKLRASGEDYIPDALSGEDIQRLHNLIVPEGRRLKYDTRGNVIGSESDKYARGGAVEALPALAAKYAKGGRVLRPGEGLPEPGLLNFQIYADTVSREMFPHERENPQRDAARHMLAAALAAQKASPGVAEFLGKAHEWAEAPLRTTGHWMGFGEPRADYSTDIHNNALGVELGGRNAGLRELLDAVEAEARRGTPKRQPGRASLEPDPKTDYADGGAVGVAAYYPAAVDSIVSQFI